VIVPGSAHLGAQVSALVDGQLTGDRADRAWQHVAGCDSCRAAVHREEWVKLRLTGLARWDSPEAPPARLAAALCSLPTGSSGAADARWPEPERRGVGTRLTVAAIGVGSLSAALVVLGAGYLADGRVERDFPAAPAGALPGGLPGGAGFTDLPADAPGTDRGLSTHRVRRPWARMEP
jgi:anti-sigma factor RsiW